jgi:hypothetical protein
MNAPASAQFRYNLPNSEAAAIAKLPKRAQQKLEHLRQIDTRMKALRSGLFDAITAARDNLQAAQRNLLKFDHDNPSIPQIIEDKETGERKRTNVDPPGRADLLAWVERCKAEVKRLTDEQTATNTGFSVADIIDWLIAQRGNFVAVPIKLPKDNLIAALERNRNHQSALNSDLIAIENTKRTAGEVKAAIRAEVAALAKKGQPDVAGLFHGQPLGWPTELLIANGAGVHQYSVAAQLKDAFALTIWANADAIIAKLDAEIERTGDDASALSCEDQAARIAVAKAKVLQLLRQGEAIIVALEAAGQQVTRTCADPLILLGIAIA